MRNRILILAGIFLSIGASWWLAQGIRAANEPPPARTVARQSVELTVYADDFGLVRELRPVTLAQGANRLRVQEVSKVLDPHSVLLRWQGGGANMPQLVAHSYDLGVEDGGGLLRRYLGSEVELVRYGENGREAERQRGTLMVETNGEVVVQTNGRFVVSPQATIEAPARGDVVTIPQLSVQAESPTAQSASLDLAYLTRGLSWSADYVGTLSPESNLLALDCWATVTNQTGVAYPNAKVSLIAGTPNRAVAEGAAASLHLADGRSRAVWGGATFARRDRLQIYGGEMASGMPIASAAPRAVGDLHVYPIRSATTISQEQMNRLRMLASPRVPVRRDYSVRLPQLSPWDDDWGTPNQPRRDDVNLALTFVNRERDGLGAPLPHGALRVYEPDRSGALRYAGAAAIPNTPRSQKVRVTLSRVFDLFAESRVMKVEKPRKRTLRKHVEVTLRNEKATAVAVRAVQGFNGRWKLVRASHPQVNLDAGNVQWAVRVPAGGKVTVSYAVDVSG